MTPRIVGTLLVRDEADIVELNIRHHLDQGIRPGWHWREEYRRLQEGNSSTSYRGKRLRVWELARGLLTGRLSRDGWLRERFPPPNGGRTGSPTKKR